MKREKTGFTTILALMSIFSVWMFPQDLRDNELEQRAFLPETEEISGWKTQGESEVYMGDDLFLYINGGAEIYHEYGFKSVIVQEYTSRNDNFISVEIFEMMDSNSSFGMYSFKTSDGGTEVEFGQEGRLEGYYMNFWKGAFIVTLIGFDESRETVAGIRLLAEAVAKRMGGVQEEDPPSILNLLPDEGLLKTGKKYFEGHLGLFNNYPFATKNLFQTTSGVMGRYRDGAKVFILSQDSEAACSAQFKEAASILKSEPRYTEVGAKGSALFLTDSKGKHILIKGFGRYIIAVTDLDSYEQGERALRQVRNTLDIKLP
ncbi:DUF6599 family protein [Acidobacteriota bacterium]